MMKKLILYISLFLFPAIGSFAFAVEPGHCYSPLMRLPFVEVIQLTPWDIAAVDCVLNTCDQIVVTRMDQEYLYCETSDKCTGENFKERKLPLHLTCRGIDRYNHTVNDWKNLLEYPFNEFTLEKNW